jgi:hypothetical protein
MVFNRKLILSTELLAPLFCFFFFFWELRQEYYGQDNVLVSDIYTCLKGKSKKYVEESILSLFGILYILYMY